MVDSYWKRYLPTLALRLLFLAFTGFQFTICAQTPLIDSLLQQLPGMPEDTNKVIIANKLSKQYLIISDLEKSQAFANEALLLAEVLAYKRGLVESNILLGNYYKNIRDWEPATKHFLLAISIADQDGNWRGLAIAHDNLGNTYDDQEYFEEALKHYDIALKAAKRGNDKSLVNYINKHIGFVYSDQGNNALALKVLEECIVFEKNTSNWQGLMDTYIATANVCNKMSSLDLAFKYFQEALKISIELEDSLQIATVYVGMGDIEMYNYNFKEGLIYYNQALEILLAINDKNGISIVYNQIAGVHYDQGNYSEALRYMHLELKLVIESNDRSGMAATYCNIANIYAIQENSKLALENQFASLKLHKEIGSKYGMAINTSAIGQIYSNLSEYDSATLYFLTSLKLFQDIEDRRGISNSYNRLGNVYEAKNEFEEAILHYEEALRLSKELGDSGIIGQCYLNLGWINAKIKNFDLSRTYLMESISLSKKLGLKPKVRQGYLAITELDSLSGNQSLALTHYKQYVIYNDSLNEESHNQVITELNIKFETEQKEKEILRLENEREINALNLQVKSESFTRMQFQRDKLNAQNLFQMERIALLDKDKQFQQLELEKKQSDIVAEQAKTQKQEAQLILLNQQGEIKDLKLKRKTQMQYYILGGFFLFALLGIYMNANYRIRQKLNLQILKQKIEETEKMALRAQMNPHFIFNCINSIDSLIQSNDKYLATIYLNKFAKLIRNILDSSKINDMTIAKDMETLKLYIELEQLRHENKFVADITIDPGLLHGDYKIPPLIIQPYIENAIIHGLRNRPDNEGKLIVTVKKIDGFIHYTIEDNGIGRTNTLKYNSGEKQSYGMNMSSERIRLFNGEEHASVTITDLEADGFATGTSVDVYLKIA